MVAGSQLLVMHGSEVGVSVPQVMMLIQNHPVPIIAMVNGLATAAGCQLVASCDIAVASDKSSFATPGVNVGLFCSTPAVALGRAVPRKVTELPVCAHRIKVGKGISVGVGRCLPHKREDLSSIPRAHIKKPGVVVYSCNPGAQKAATDGHLELAGWPRKATQ